MLTSDGKYRSPEAIARRKVKLAAKRLSPERKLQYKARCAVSNAVRDGKLVRPTICPQCDDECMVEAHHPDYTKPLEVEWLCAPCHQAEHF